MYDPETIKNAYDAGYDAAINKSNEYNCNFRWFGTPSSLKDWERGNEDGKKELLNQRE
jgi:hypothetical protein